MSEPAASAEVFVVRLDRGVVVAKRAGARRANQVGMALSLVAGLLLLGVGVAGLVGALLGHDTVALGLVGVAGIAFLCATVAQGRVLKRARPWYDAANLPDEAIRLTAEGMLLGSEGAAEPVWLPWSTVAGFRYGHVVGQPVLTLMLMPGVTPTTPGVRGLDQPEVARAFGPGNRRRGIFYGVAALDQDVADIDAAMRAFTGGRAGVLR